MPNIGFGELIIILLVALIVFGPRKLPEIGRALGKSVREFRKATTTLKSEFERELDDDPPFSRPPAARRRAEGREASPNGEPQAAPEGARAEAEGEADTGTGDPDPD